MAPPEDKKRPPALGISAVTRSPSLDSNSSGSTDLSLKQPRTPRFAEATAVHSPIEGKKMFGGKRMSVKAPADIGFGYINDSSRELQSDVPMTPRSPLKSAMKVPGTAKKTGGFFSPTFKEEEILERREMLTEKEQARDLKIKTRVRMAKAALRGVNFSCSLIILSMLTSSMVIFRMTKDLPAQNGLPPWASNTNAWPQKVVLAAACLNLCVCIGIFIGYCRGGHRRAEKVGVYYTLFAVGWFIFSSVMWAAAAGILQFSKNNSKNQDMWGWACVQNKRSELFNQKVDYALVCRLQNWSLICIVIEIVVEVISITLYSVIFYRYYSKRRLHKTMDMRDRARSDLYLSQLRMQSAPNTPGFGPKSPSYSTYALSPRFPPAAYQSLDSVEGGQATSPFTPGGKRLVVPQSSFASLNARAAANGGAQPFKLQAPPTKAPSATPKSPGGLLSTPSTASPSSDGNAPRFNFQVTEPQISTIPESAPMAPGEQQYEAVPIPGAYVDAAPKAHTGYGVQAPGPALTR